MTDRTRGTPEPPPAGSRSLFRLTRDLLNGAVDLVRQEADLARIDVVENVRNLGRVGGLAAIGGVTAAVGVVIFVEFLVIGLGVLLGGAYWLSSLIVAVALIAGGAGTAYLGVRRLERARLAPTRTLKAASETRRWIGDELGDVSAVVIGGRKSAELSRPTRLEGAGVGAGHEPRQPFEETAAAEAKFGRRPLTDPLYRRVFHEVREDDILGQAAKVAYFMFTSLPPALLVIFALTSIFGGDPLANFITGRLDALLPGSTDDPNSAAAFVASFINDVVTETAPAPLSIGLVLGLWAASAVFSALTNALNQVFDVTEDRSWLRRKGVALGVMAGFLILFLGGSVSLIAGPQISDVLGLGAPTDVAWNVLQWPLGYIFVTCGLFLIYNFLPNCDLSDFRLQLLKGSAIATALWIVATAGFRIYIANFGSFGETYGFVGAILVLLLWMYITAIVILVGGEFGSELARGDR